MKIKPFQDIFDKKEKKPIKRDSQKVIIDFREKNSLVPSQLVNLGLEIEFRQLKIGDYQIGNTLIERKTFSDFINSMIDKRIFRQLEELKQFPNSFLIIEEFDLNSEKFSNKNALRGLILSIILRYKIPIVFVKDYFETAEYIKIISNKKEKEVSLNYSKKSLSKKEQLQFVLEAFPNVGPAKAKKLLEKFQTIKNISNSSEKDLEEILGKRAKEFLEILERKY
ncbi:MAG: ERCC4 domain-containing protein [Candidatus Pacearchaeota archaeon]|jgi:Fanconi anemia group M protein